LSMIAGSGFGLLAYFTIGWFVASLVGATVSGIVFVVATLAAPDDFSFSRLAESGDTAS